MKQLLSFIGLICLAIVVTSCGATDSSSTTDNGSQQAASPEVVYTVSGVFESSGETNANIFCDDGDGMSNQFFEIGFLHESQQFDLSLVDGVSGTVTLIGEDDAGANPGDANYVGFRDSDFTNYQLGTGELVIENFPASAGEMFIGSMTAELSDDDGNTVNIDAEFNINTSASTFEDCPTE